MKLRTTELGFDLVEADIGSGVALEGLYKSSAPVNIGRDVRRRCANASCMLAVVIRGDSFEPDTIRVRMHCSDQNREPPSPAEIGDCALLKLGFQVLGNLAISCIRDVLSAPIKNDDESPQTNV